MSTLYAPHAPRKKLPGLPGTGEHLANVMKEMARRGPPTIRAVRDGDVYFAIEGSHRIAAAARLGMSPIIKEVKLTDRVRHDFDSLGDRSGRAPVAEIVAYLSGKHVHGPTRPSWLPTSSRTYEG